jgi:iron complex outermembrane receptor protein
MTSSRLTFKSACALGALLPIASAASAQTAAPTQVAEVVVTAERRSSDLQTTPLAISALSSQALDASFVNEISGLNAIVPSLEITRTSGFEQLVTIRGIGSETPENAPTTVPGVSEFIDGVYVANTVSLDQALFDIDHIEVLRGPQGALYGQSSIGGAINIVSQQPVLSRFEGSGDVSAGTYELFRERAALNVPVGDDLAVRASIQAYDHQGFATDVAIPGFRLDDAHDDSGKIAALWRPNPTFSATLTGQWEYADQNGAEQKNINDPDPNPRVVDQDYPAHFRLATQLYHLNLEWDGPFAIVKSVTAYQGLDHVQREDSSRSAFALIGAYDDVAAWNTKLANYTQEIDLLSKPDARLEWTVGAFFLNQTSRQFVAEFEGHTANPDTTIASNVETVPPANLAYGNQTDVSRRSVSGFGQATYHLTSALRLTVGARINYDAYSLGASNFAASGIDHVSHGYSDSQPTGRVELDYDASGQTLIYGSVARGYKPGGVNGTYGQYVVPVTFSPETNTAFEVGAKNELFGRTLKLNLATYYDLYRNMQYIETDPVPFDEGMSNIPSVHTYGLEGEAFYTAPDHRLRLNASLAVENGQVASAYKTLNSTTVGAIENTYAYPCYAGPYTFYVPGGGPACAAVVEAAAEQLKGKTPPAMPKLSGSLNASYTFDAPGGVLTPRVEYVYRGSEWARIFNVPSLDRVPAYGVVNLNLEYARSNSPLRLSIAATNLFNVAGVNSRYTDPYGTGQTSQEFIPPLQVVGTVRYAF